MSRLRAVCFTCFVLVLVLVSFAPVAVEAAERFWIDSAGGGFGTPGVADANWSLADGGAGGATVPGAADVANFTLNSTYDVTFSVAVTNTDLDVENGNVTFDLDGFTYTGTGGIPIAVGNVPGQTGRLTVTNGIVAVDTVGDNVQMGVVNNGTGFLTIGTGGQLGTAGTRPGVIVGQLGNGTLTVQNDGEVFADLFFVGNNPGVSGTASITGPQVRVDVSSLLHIGDDGNGTVTLSSGADLVATNATTIGVNSGSVGTLTITGADSTWTQSTSITIGSSGVGTLNVQSGGSLTAGTTTIGSTATSFGTATVSGGGSASTQALTVGNSGTGTLTVTGIGSSLVTNGLGFTVGSAGTGDGNVTVSAGGSIAAGLATLGSLAGSSGSMSVTGSSSSFTSTSGNFVVGTSGAGSLEIAGGATVNSLTARIANSVGSTGSVTVSGAGSTWNASSLAIGGQIAANGGTGTLTVSNDGTVNVSGATEIRSSAGSALTLDGGTLVTGNFTRLGTLNFNDGTLHVKGVYDHGSAAAPLVIDGAASDDLPTLRLSTNLSVLDVTSITVGNTNQGALVLDGGRSINTGANNISIGAGPLSSGTVFLSDNTTMLTTSGIIAVGGNGAAFGGSGVLTLEDAAIAGSTTATINLFTGGVINIDGGHLRAGTFNANGGTINFTSGSFLLNGPTLDDARLDAIFGEGHVLGPGRTLAHALIAGPTLNAPLNVNGGVFNTVELTNASVLQVNDGAVDASSSLINNAGALLTISGTGLVRGGSFLTNNGTIQLNNNLVPTSGATLSNSGTIRGTGFIGHNLTNNLSGQVQATAGSRLEFQGATNTNTGSISLVGGEVVFAGSVTNSANTGLISGRDAILRTGGITNNGSLAFTAGQMDVYGDVTNNVGGRITVSGGGITTFYDDVTIAVGASNVQATAVGGSVSSVVFFGSYNGAVSGGGTAFIEGDHRPGNSPALVKFDGDVAYGSLSALVIEIGGTDRGGEYDAVDALGAVALSGALEVELVDLGNGVFVPNAGDVFTIIGAADGVSGTFASEVLPAIGGGLFLDVVYGANEVTLSAMGVTGDYNFNGIVDEEDYTAWRDTLDKVGSGLDADGNANGAIDAGDYDVWKANFGATAGSGAGSSSGAVPEPATLWMLLLGIPLVCSLRLAQPRGA